MESRSDIDRKFYDIHYHLFDLSHPNLLAFLLRDDLISKDSVQNVLKKLPFLAKLLPIGAAQLFPGKIAEKIKDYIQNDAGNFRNLLAVMENAVEYHFLYTEYYLLKEQVYFGSSGRMKFNKIVLCPLLMDFGYKNLNNSNCFYNLPPSKPIAKQVLDLLNAIGFYYRYDLIPHPDKQGRLKLIPSLRKKQEKLFEIYPFLGINTQNYDLVEVKELFDKYFTGYENDNQPGERQKKLFDKLGTIKVDLEDLIFRKKEKEDTEYYTYLFAGIKLYPPMGFDPWPEDNPSELEKVKFLYSECIRKGLPVTVHCSDGGFVTTPDAAFFTDPSKKWQKVLKNPDYRNLRINFAHLGSQSEGRSEWQTTIMNAIAAGNNIYTDCSCITPQSKDYATISRLINSSNEKNILFGTDFLINLLWSGSYNEYLDNFILNQHLTGHQKNLMCNLNPAKFLFG
jgi:predicted TIM-barrel fold metal-dependent hydrolase